MNIQRLRNLTTGRLHTKMSDIYEDIEYLTREKGVLTHMLPNACRALRPYLQSVAPDPKLWANDYDPDHSGEIEIPPMNDEQCSEFWKRYASLIAGEQPK